MLLPAEVGVILASTKVDRPNHLSGEVWRVSRLLLTIALLAATASILAAQMMPISKSGAGAVLIRVVGDNDQPIDLPAHVVIWPEGDMSRELQTTSSNGTAQFTRLLGGRYTIEVDLPGFKRGNGEAEVMDFGTVDVSVHMETDDPSSGAGAKGMLLAPKAQKEVDDGLRAMRALNYTEAEKHFGAAYKLAPGNPEVVARSSACPVSTGATWRPRYARPGRSIPAIQSMPTTGRRLTRPEGSAGQPRWSSTTCLGESC